MFLFEFLESPVIHPEVSSSLKEHDTINDIVIFKHVSHFFSIFCFCFVCTGLSLMFRPLNVCEVCTDR